MNLENNSCRLAIVPILSLVIISLCGSSLVQIISGKTSVFADRAGLQGAAAGVPGRAYYFSSSGNDGDGGTKVHPWKTIKRLNDAWLQAGDTVYFRGGEIFEGRIELRAGSAGNPTHPLAITSYGKGKAVIRAGDGFAIGLYQAKYISIANLQLAGSGRKNGNTQNGLAIDSCSNILIDSLDITGFQKAGVYIHQSVFVRVTRVHAHENGAAGIDVEGTNGKKDCSNLYIANCLAEDNPGDPSNLTNHSGNGIVVGNCRNITIEYCTATNNGWDMPRIGNGPVGIWAYEADSVIIQHCLSYRNKTSVGGADGGGFDLDGGVTHSVIQYCLSYENQGAGYCIFQYLYASPWHDNVFRYNISENDGSVSDARAGVHIWNSSRDKDQFYNCLFYNNTIYNAKGASISYSEVSERKGFVFYNNIFVARDSLVKGERAIDVFLADDWWSLTKKFNIERIYDFATWANTSGQEKLSGKIIGLNINPSFKNPDNTKLTTSSALRTFDKYKIPANSPLRNNGLDLHGLYGIETGNLDFNQQPLAKRGIGACF